MSALDMPVAPPPSLWRILWRAGAEASITVRARLAITGVLWLSMIGTSTVDVGVSAQPAVAADRMSLVLGLVGTFLFMLVQVLESEAKRRADDPRRPAEAPRALHPVLMAVPTLGLLVGVLLSAAVALLVVRILLGAPALFMAGLAAPYLAFLVLTARSVSGSTRALYRHAEQSTASAARAAAEAGEAQLAALQAQMNPHFLFNALNTVAALVRTDPAAAESTVENLSDVLRLTLRRTEETVRTLGDEIDYLRAYLSIEKQRLGERLRIRWDVPEDLGPAELPPMTLQPLVENALRHGPGSRIEGGELRISAAARGGRLCLEVADDGPGFVRGYREGTGLGNLRRRLSTLYGTQASLRVSTDAAGARVIVELPLRLRPHPDPRSSVLT